MIEEQREVALPQAFVEKMKGLLGESSEAFFQSYEAKRVQGLRFNPLKGDMPAFLERYGKRFGLWPVPWCREGFYYEQDARPGRSDLHEAGAYYIQEPSAMAVTQLLDPRPGERILDLCAAPGGKATHVAGRMEGQGLLVSNEIHPARAKILSQNVERMGIANAVVTNEDSGKLSRHFPLFFHKIVVDAPCSGEGMFRKDEQARQEWSQDNVMCCASRQQEILDHAADMLLPGGRLVYSTCTFSPEENEDGIGAFLERHPEFSIVKVVSEENGCLEGLSPGHPEWCRPGHPELADTFRIWPHLAEGEGHYLALLEKAAKADCQEDDQQEKRQPFQFRNDQPGRKQLPKFWEDKSGKKMVRQFLEETLNLDGGMIDTSDFLDSLKKLDRLVLFGEQVYLLPEGMPEFSGLRVLRPGLHLGTLKKNRLEPSHGLALALSPRQAQRTLELEADSQQSLAYRKGQTLDAPSGLKGWVLVSVDGCSLGWGKASGGVVKNHYPKGLRI